MKIIIPLAAAILAAFPGAAETGQRPPVQSFSSLPDEEKTDIFTLATIHLAGVDGATPEAADALIDELENWGPDVIAIERMPARVIEALKRDPVFDEALDTFIGEAIPLGEAMQAETGLSASEAEDAIEGWQGAPDTLPADDVLARLKTAIAAYQPETALLYWSLLGEGQISSIPAETRTLLDETEASSNERVLLALALARRLGHAQLWSVDSHADKDLFMRSIEPLEQGIANIDATAMPGAQPYMQTLSRLRETGLVEHDLLPLYRYLNSEEFGAADLEGQFDLFNRAAFEDDAGRLRQATWDERNYHIAANIRRASAFAPGGRVLVIIGAGHKPFLDELMKASLDVKVSQDVIGEWAEDEQAP
jgi:hypothetical protein